MNSNSNHNNPLQEPLLAPPLPPPPDTTRVVEESSSAAAAAPPAFEQYLEQQQQHQQQHSTVTYMDVDGIVTATTTNHLGGEDDSTGGRFFQGQVQAPVYRDVVFGIAFYIQLFAMLTTAVWFGPYAWRHADNLVPPANTTATTTMMMTFEGDDPEEEEDHDAWVYWHHGGGLLKHMAPEKRILLAVLGGIAITTAVAILVSALLLGWVQRYSHQAVQVTFLATPLTAVLLALAATVMILTTPSSASSSPDPNHQQIAGTLAVIWSMVGLIMVVAGLHYCCFRRFIPFTASNLQAALSALRRNASLYGVAVLFQVLLTVYWMIGLIALGGVVSYMDQKQVPCSSSDDGDDHYYYWGDNNDDSNTVCHGADTPVWFYMVWIFSMYWTQAVLQNVLRTTTAGVIGTWWFQNPEELELNDEASRSGLCVTCCNDSVQESLYRATTLSFGSVCLGSLLIAVVQVLELIVRAARKQREEEQERQRQNRDYARVDAYTPTSILLCVADCLLQWLGTLLEYLNSWAFIYVGLYGYDYMTAGKNVMTLFQQRGLTFVLSDQLLYHVLNYLKFCIAAVSGTVVWMIAIVARHTLVLFPSSTRNDTTVWWGPWFEPIGFVVGFLLGWFVAALVLFVLESAVRTVIVCFAERPVDGAVHHPTEYQSMALGWSRTYPQQPQPASSQPQSPLQPPPSAFFPPPPPPPPLDSNNMILITDSNMDHVENNPMDTETEPLNP